MRRFNPASPDVPSLTPPTTYAEWSRCLDRLESGHDQEHVVQAIEDGTLSWTSGVAEQFARRIHHVFDTRLTACSDNLNRQLSRGSDEATVVRAMAEARRTIALLFRVANAPSLPETLRGHLTAELQRFAQCAQDSLEQSATADRQGHLLHTVRHHTLTRFEQAVPESLRPRTSDAALGVVGRRRNILP